MNLSKIQGCKPGLFPQNSTVNPLLLQPIIHVWHIRGKVHTGILSSLHYYYVFSMLRWAITRIRQLLIAVNTHFWALCWYKFITQPCVTPARSAAATPATDVIARHLIWLQSNMSDEWRSLRSMKVSCEWLRSVPSFGMSGAHTHKQQVIHTSPLPVFPLLVFRHVELHT